MRWKQKAETEKPIVHVGDCRIIRKFLLKPKCIQKEWRWLEIVSYHQTYRRMHAKYSTTDYWKDDYWMDIPIGIKKQYKSNCVIESIDIRVGVRRMFTSVWLGIICMIWMLSVGIGVFLFYIEVCLLSIESYDANWLAIVSLSGIMAASLGCLLGIERIIRKYIVILNEGSDVNLHNTKEEGK
jgi:hypothetical protein